MASRMSATAAAAVLMPPSHASDVGTVKLSRRQ
jgi:hypothetical protein